MTNFSTDTGYRDWERVSSLVADPMVNAHANIAPAGDTYGPFYVAAYPTTRVIVTPNPGNTDDWLVTIEWAADENFIFPIESFNWHMADGKPLCDAVPNMGTWMRVYILDTLGGGGVPYYVNVMGTTAPPVGGRLFIEKLMFSEWNGLWSAGQSTLFVQDFVTTGPASMCFTSDATDWAVTLNTYSAGLEQNVLCQIGPSASTPGDPKRVILPEWSTSIRISNVDGVARHFSGSLVLE